MMSNPAHVVAGGGFCGVRLRSEEVRELASALVALASELDVVEK